MALVKCKECAREISDQAPACPGCGAPMAAALGIPSAWTASDPPSPSPTQLPLSNLPADKKPQLGTLVLAVVGVLVVVGILSQCAEPAPSSSASNSQSSTPPPPAQTAEERKQLIATTAARMESEDASPLARLGYAETLILKYPNTPEAKRAAELVDGLKAEADQSNRGRQWRYTESEDAMSSKNTYSGSVTSNNSFEFDFPYKGQQSSRLTVRRHPRWGTDVMLSIERGQILCSSYDCPVRVRFDDGPPQNFGGTEPADNSSESVFIDNHAGFVRKLEKAKRVKIEVNIYDHGVLVSEFDVDGFKPERLKPSTGK